MQKRSAQACILGGGPAGLAAAHELASSGHGDLVIIDRNASWGGLSRTEVHGGNRFDVGPHRFFTKSAEVRRLWQDILKDDFRPVKRITRILHNGNLYKYPLDPLDAARKLGFRKAVEALASFAATRIGRTSEPTNFEEWTIHAFGPVLYQTFFKTYTEKVWGIPCREIGVEWATQRIRGLNMKALLVSSLPTFGRRPRSLVKAFHYPRLGSGMMYSAMAERLHERKVELHLSTEVRSVALGRGGKGFEVRAVARNGTAIHVSCEQLFSSLPITTFAGLFRPQPPEAVLTASELLFHRDHITVNLVVGQDDLFPDQWLYIHTPEIGMARVANYNNFSLDMVRKPGTSLLSAEYFTYKDGKMWRRSDRQLVDLAVHELTEAGVVPAGSVEGGAVVRETESYPTYYLGYRSALQTLLKFFCNVSGLAFIGRGGMYRYDNMDHAILSGLLAARGYLEPTASIASPWDVNRDRAYHEAPSS